VTSRVALLMLLAVVTALCFALNSAALAAEPKPAASEAPSPAAKLNVWRCPMTDKVWTQPSEEKRACPYCGKGMAEHGVLLGQVPASPPKAEATPKTGKEPSAAKPGATSKSAPEAKTQGHDHSGSQGQTGSGHDHGTQSGGNSGGHQHGSGGGGSMGGCGGSSSGPSRSPSRPGRSSGGSGGGCGM